MAHRTKHFLLFIILVVLRLFRSPVVGTGNSAAGTGGTHSASSSQGGQSGSGGTAGSGSTSNSGGTSGGAHVQRRRLQCDGRLVQVGGTPGREAPSTGGTAGRRRRRGNFDGRRRGAGAVVATLGRLGPPSGGRPAAGRRRASRAMARGQAAVVARWGRLGRHPVARPAAADRRAPAEPSPLSG